MNLNQVTLPTVDMQQSNAFYQQMGFIQIVDTPHYARFECPEGDATFSLSLTDQITNNPTVIYFECENVDEKVSQLEAIGMEFEQQPTDERYLWREAVIYDPSGNKIKLYWAGENRKNPPWRINRRVNE